MLPHSMLGPGTESIPCVQVSLLHLLRYVVGKQKRSILSPVVEDRLVLVPFQRNPGTHVLKSWPFMVVSRGAPKDSVRGKESMTAFFFLAGLLSQILGKQTITAD